jgi:long-chain fatty acid transport protein
LKKIAILCTIGLTVLVAGLHLTSNSLFASAFALYTSGASELALCDSAIAHTEGSASNFWNPALLPELDGTQLEIGTIFLRPSVEFSSDLTGKETSLETNTFFPSTIFISHKINERFSAGFGLNSTFGLGTEWPDDWEGRYIATNSELQTFNFNPNIAWKLSEKLVVAIGFNILLGEATLEQKIDPFFLLLPSPDGNSKLKADGNGYGYDVGILYKFSEELAFGMSYRSGIKLELDGDIKWSQAGISIVDTGVKSDLELPAQLFGGISCKMYDRILVEIGGKWENWSSYKHLKLKADQPIFFGSNIFTVQKDWHDVYSFNVGVKYMLGPDLTLLAGFSHEENPIPSETFDPSIPCSDKNWYSFGIRKSLGNFKIMISYLYDKYESRYKNNNVAGLSVSGMTANGKYSQDIHMAGLSLSYSF